jgi:hypothetical protein
MNFKSMGRTMKKLVGLCLVVSMLLGSPLFSQEEKVRVKANRISIYAEADSNSYRIEVLKKGTILTLFGTGQSKEGWWYVYYQSPRWGSKVTGFVQADMVERIDSEVAEKREPEKVEPADVKPVEVERRLAVVSLVSSRLFDLPLDAGFKDEPRIFSMPEKVEPTLEELPAKIEAVTTEEMVEVTLRSGKNYSMPRFGDFKIHTPVFEIPRKPGPKPKPKQPELSKEPIKPEIRKDKEEPVKKPEPKLAEKPEVKKELQIEAKQPKRNLFTMSLGFGPSWGGLGSFIQVNTKSGFSLHGGVGYYPTSLFYPEFDWVEGKMLYSVGIKYYLPLRTSQVRPYIDLQYGGLSVEAIRVVAGIWYFAYVFENLQKTLWGPSLLGGVEVRFGSFGLNGALGISYVVTKWEYWDQPLFMTADFGFLLYF